MKLGALVEKIGGTLEGDGEVEIEGIASLKEAGEGDLTFFSNPKYAAALAKSQASAVVVKKGWEGESPCAVVRVQNTDRAMAIAASVIGPHSGPLCDPGIHESAIVKEGAHVAADVRVGPFCVIESGAIVGSGTVLVMGCYVGHEAEIGKDCVLHTHAVVRERVKIGDRVILHEGSVVGGDGFGNYLEGGQWRKIPHVGTVEIGDDSEIGVHSTIDRSRFGKTFIGKNVKIDNLVMVGHNVRIGDHTAIAAQTGIAGSTVVGKGVLLGGQVGLSGHLNIGDGAIAGAQAGVTKDVAPGTYVTGYPAMPHRKAAETHANLMRLQAWKDRVKHLEARIAAIEKRTASEQTDND